MNNLDDFEPLSNCCTAPTDEDTLVCGECGEHCELLSEGEHSAWISTLWLHD